MKLSQLYSTSPFKRLSIGTTQFGSKRSSSAFMPQPTSFKPAYRGRSILSRKRLYYE